MFDVRRVPCHRNSNQTYANTGRRYSATSFSGGASQSSRTHTSGKMELKELVRRVEDEGYILLWSNVLQDLVAFHHNDVDPVTIPAAFVPYSEHELLHLFDEDGAQLSADILRLIHAAKKTGAIITNSRKEGSETGNA